MVHGQQVGEHVEDGGEEGVARVVIRAEKSEF